MRSRKAIRLFETVAFYCWLISLVNAGIVISPAGARRDNNFGLERLGIRRSAELEPTIYRFHRPEVGSYVYGFDYARDSRGNEHYGYGERFNNGTVIGEYGFIDDVNSLIVVVKYTADQNGYRPIVIIRRLER